MLRATQSCVRVVSPVLQRHRINPIACVPEMSTESSSKEPKVSKKSTKAKKTATSSAPKGAPVKAPEPVEKGDSYTAGTEYFSFNPYSFYDIENSVQPLRCPQPTSEKMKDFCLDKLNPEDEPEPRKLLAEDHGDMVEYPGRVEPRKTEKPAPSIMQHSYDLPPTVLKEQGSHCRARVPL